MFLVWLLPKERSDYCPVEKKFRKAGNYNINAKLLNIKEYANISPTLIFPKISYI